MKLRFAMSVLICLVVTVADRNGTLFLSQVCFLPVLWISISGGFKWGGALTAGCFLMVWLLNVGSLDTRLIFSFVLLATGLLAGILSEHQRRVQNEYEQRFKEMSVVQDKLQASFEGMKRSERLSALGQLSAGLAHEIRNPLASIAGAATILERNQNLNSQDARCLEIIRKECHRLDGLLTNFLNFARPRAPRFQAVDLNPVLDVVLDLAAHGLRGKQVQLVKKVSNPLSPVECDPEQLEQVLLNLVINAIEASPEGEDVVLSASQHEGRVAIQVSDHGHGVSLAHVDRLFDPFFTTKENGTGLGLPVAHQIVAQMGGTLSAMNNSDQGMIFSVVLPSASIE